MKSMNLYCDVSICLLSFCPQRRSFWELLWAKMVIKFERGNFIKMSVSYIRNTHFWGSRWCEFQSKPIDDWTKHRMDFEVHVFELLTDPELQKESKKSLTLNLKSECNMDWFSKKKKRKTLDSKTKMTLPDARPAGTAIRARRTSGLRTPVNSASAGGAPDF